MEKVTKLEWVAIDSLRRTYNDGYRVEKAKVPGGYLVRITNEEHISMTFVPNTDYSA
jgi:hypothetical protein